ncbi:MAG: hypothetical protein ACRC7C_11680 [Beijerinckiaceae bacterium]
MFEDLIEITGYAAAIFTGCAFYSKGMLALRSFALMANFLFIAYAAAKGLNPILVLHSILLPINIIRLAGVIQHRRERARIKLT